MTAEEQGNVTVIDETASAPQAVAPLRELARPSDRHLEASLEIEVQRAAQEVNVKVLAARSLPRDMEKVRQRIKAECQDLGLAEIAGYHFGKGESEVSGPSIHLAVMVARCFGNCRWGLFEHRNPNEGRQTSEWEATCWDQETGGESVLRFTVEPIHYTSGKKLEKPRDVSDNAMAVGRRKLRNAIQDIVGRPLLYQALDWCREALKTDTSKNLNAGIQKLVTAFEALGVSQGQLEKSLDKKLTQMTAEDVANLRQVYASIKNGQAKVSEVFEAPDAVAPREEAVKLHQEKLVTGADMPPSAVAPTKEEVATGKRKGKKDATTAGSAQSTEASSATSVGATSDRTSGSNSPDPKSEKSTTPSQSDSSTGTADASPKSDASSAELKADAATEEKAPPGPSEPDNAAATLEALFA